MPVQYTASEETHTPGTPCTKQFNEFKAFANMNLRTTFYNTFYITNEEHINVYVHAIYKSIMVMA